MAVKVRELTPSQTLSVPCPTCGAAIREVCELHSGAPRTEPHRDRKLAAADAVEARLSKRKRLPPSRAALLLSLVKVCNLPAAWGEYPLHTIPAAKVWPNKPLAFSRIVSV